jgi:hypothetical protein
VNQHRNRQAIGERTAGLERRRIERIHRMRRDRRRDQIVVGELRGEFLGARQAVGRRLRVGDREPDDRLAEDAAEPCRARDARDLLLEVVHVRVGGRPRLDHLQRREPRSGAHELGRDRPGFGRKNVLLQPVHQREIVGEAPEQHHRRMRVRVDQPWHDHAAAGVEGVGRGVGCGDRVRPIHGDNVASIDRDCAAVDDAARRVFGDDGPVREQEGNAARLTRNCGRRERDDGRGAQKREP